MIIMDSREPKYLYDKLIQLVSDVKIEVMNYGDYIIVGERGKVVIERKTVFDLFNSIDDGRIWEQLKGIEKFDDFKRILVVEGNIAALMKLRKSVTLPRWIGTKASIIASWNNISIVQTATNEETCMFIASLDKKLGTYSNNYISPNIIKGHRTTDEEMLDGLMAYTDIGGKKAVALLEEFGTLSNVFKASKRKLESVIGVAGGKMYDTLRKKYKED